MTLVPWQSLSGVLAADKKRVQGDKRTTEKVLLERQGFGEEGGEGDAY